MWEVPFLGLGNIEIVTWRTVNSMDQFVNILNNQLRSGIRLCQKHLENVIVKGSMPGALPVRRKAENT